MEISVIIPVGIREETYPRLLDDLHVHLPRHFKKYEILCCVGKQEVDPIPGTVRIRSAHGRAHQMNAGAKKAQGNFFWFLHADSLLTTNTVSALWEHLKADPTQLYFSRLQFAQDGPALMSLNEWGARFRSEALGIPFGDQGLALSKTLFKKIGPFDTEVPYGEDHLFVWRARQKKIPITSTGGTLITSARKYRTEGWLSVTARHLFFTARQAFPEACKTLLSK